MTAVARDTAQALPVGHGVFTKVVDLSAKVAIGASDGVTFIAGTEKRKDKDYIKNSKANTVFWVSKNAKNYEISEDLEAQLDYKPVQSIEEFSKILNNSAAIVSCKKLGHVIKKRNYKPKFANAKLACNKCMKQITTHD